MRAARLRKRKLKQAATFIGDSEGDSDDDSDEDSEEDVGVQKMAKNPSARRTFCLTMSDKKKQVLWKQLA